MRAWPRISVVTPSYNQGQFLETTIRSVLLQDYPNLEYIVMDGGSTDGSVDIIRKYSHWLTHWESKPDKGQTNALNLGFRHATGDILAYLNSDDLLLGNAIAQAVDFFAQNPEIDVLYGNRILIDEQDKRVGDWILHGHDDEVLSYADYIPQETMFWRKRIWDKVGASFDESFNFAMDWDIILRFRESGARFAHIPSFLGGFRIHSAQKTSSIINELGEQEMQRLRTRELGHPPTDMEIRSNTIPFLAKHTPAHLKHRKRYN